MLSCIAGLFLLPSSSCRNKFITVPLINCLHSAVDNLLRVCLFSSVVRHELNHRVPYKVESIESFSFHREVCCAICGSHYRIPARKLANLENGCLLLNTHALAAPCANMAASLCRFVWQSPYSVIVGEIGKVQC